MCVYQEHNGDAKFRPVRALSRRCFSIQQTMSNRKIYLSAYWVGGKRKDVTSDNMSAALKFAATALDYLSFKFFPVKIVDTH